MKNELIDKDIIMDKKTQRRLAKLDALEAGGVDNWTFYDEALEGWREENELEELREEMTHEIMEALIDNIYEPSERGAGYAVKDESVIYAVVSKYLIHKGCR